MPCARAPLIQLTLGKTDYVATHGIWEREVVLMQNRLSIACKMVSFSFERVTFVQENMPLLSSNVNSNLNSAFVDSDCSFRWKRMPKHIKISKHADTQKFYVSDVCEFLSVEVSL